MIPLLHRLAAPVRNQLGVAFPVALIGLLALSVTITAVLLTGSTQTALSTAHQDATRDLYIAQGGLEAYVAQAGLGLAPTNSPVRYLAPGAPASDSALINVRQIANVAAAKPTWPNDLILSVEAQPIRGGRTIAAVARVISTVLTLKNEVDAAVVSGSDVSIKGNTTVSNGSDSPYCAAADSAGYAIQVDQDDTVSTTNNVKVKGEVGSLEGDEYGYINEMLGTTFENLIANAEIKFGPGQFGTTSITSLATGTTPNVANLSDPQLTPYNWGCPRDLLAGSNQPCEVDTDTAHLPIVAIDASNPDGSWGTVTVNLSHGQGMLVVYNGNLRIQGNLVYKGLILVEGAFTVSASGGGANAPKIEGSIIGLGRGSGLSEIDEAEADNTISGSPTIRYNRCAIDLVVKAITSKDTFDREARPTSSWFEVVR